MLKFVNDVSEDVEFFFRKVGVENLERGSLKDNKKKEIS